jgi:hypothetical protein
MLPHVFESFWQVERTRDHSEGGLGIGLALVRKLVEMHGGSVSANSPGLGRGSEFVVRLPLAATWRGQDSATNACDRPADPPSHRNSRADENAALVECLARSGIGLAVSQVPIDLYGRKSILGSPLFRSMNCGASGDPRFDLDADASRRDSCLPSQQKHGPRDQWRVNYSVQ